MEHKNNQFKNSHDPLLPKLQPCFHYNLWDKKYFSIFSSHFLKKLKTNGNVNLLYSNLQFTQITFLDALNFSILEERRYSLSLSYTEKIKPQRPDSVAPSVPGANKCFLQSVSSTICILYTIYEQSHAQRPLPSLISKNLWAPYLIHQFYRKKVLTV